MERLERDLEGDVKERFEQQNPYTEELLQILVEVSDALIFAKLQGVAYRNILIETLSTYKFRLRTRNYR